MHAVELPTKWLMYLARCRGVHVLMCFFCLPSSSLFIMMVCCISLHNSTSIGSILRSTRSACAWILSLFSSLFVVIHNDGVLHKLAQSSTSIGSILRSMRYMAPIDNASAFGISQLSSIRLTRQQPCTNRLIGFCMCCCACRLMLCSARCVPY